MVDRGRERQDCMGIHQEVMRSHQEDESVDEWDENGRRQNDGSLQADETQMLREHERVRTQLVQRRDNECRHGHIRHVTRARILILK